MGVSDTYNNELWKMSEKNDLTESEIFHLAKNQNMDMEKLEEKIKKLTKQNQNLTQQKDEKTGENSQLHKNIEKQQKTIDELQKRIKYLEIKYNKAQLENKEIQKTYEVLQGKVIKQTEKNTDLMLKVQNVKKLEGKIEKYES